MPNKILLALTRRSSWLLIISILAIAISLFLIHALSQFTSVLIGRDASYVLWSLWYPAQAIHLNQEIITTNYAVFPSLNNLLLVISPLFSLTWYGMRRLTLSQPLAFNLLYAVSLFFTGWAFFAYLRHHRQPKGLAMLLALFFAFSPLMHYRLLQGRPDLMMLGWIPLGLIVWDNIRETGQKGWQMVVIAIATLLTSLQVFVWTFMLWLPYFICTIVNGTKPDQKQLLVNTILWQCLLLMAVGLSYPLPVLLKTLYGIVPGVATLTLQPQDWSLSLGFILMMALGAILLGVSTTAGSLRYHGLWLILSLVYFGAAGLTQVGWLETWNAVMAPVDWFVPAATALYIFAARGLGDRLHLLQQWFFGSRWTHKLVGLGLIGVIALQAPPILVPWNPTPLYTKLGQEPGTYTILDVPLGVHFPITGETYGADLTSQQYAVLHRKRTINGAYTCVGKQPIQYFEQTDLFPFLAGKTLDVTPTMAKDLQTAIADLQIGYIIVQPQQLEASHRANTLKFLADQETSLCRVFIDSSVIAYRTSWHPWGCQPVVE